MDELVAFMSLPIFYELRTAVDVGILLFDDLDEYDLPEGYSKEDIWRILLAVRKQAAVFVPEDPGAHGRHVDGDHELAVLQHRDAGGALEGGLLAGAIA